MDFEIEDDDPYNFESNWSKPSKKGYFGASGFGADTGGGDDVYDYDYGGGAVKTDTTHYSSSPESYTKAHKKENKPAPATTAPKAIEKVTSTNVLEKAKSMLSKYPTKTAPQKQAPRKFTDDFDEDDISLGSDDYSDDDNKKQKPNNGFPESPGDFEVVNKFKPTLSKKTTNMKSFDLGTEAVGHDDDEAPIRGFDLENDDEDDDLNASDDMGARMMTSGPSLYGDLTTEHAKGSRMLDESMADVVDDEENYSKDFDDSMSQRSSDARRRSDDTEVDVEYDNEPVRPKVFSFANLDAITADGWQEEESAEQIHDSQEESQQYQGNSFEEYDPDNAPADEPKGSVSIPATAFSQHTDVSSKIPSSMPAAAPPPVSAENKKSTGELSGIALSSSVTAPSSYTSSNKSSLESLSVALPNVAAPALPPTGSAQPTAAAAPSQKTVAGPSHAHQAVPPEISTTVPQSQTYVIPPQQVQQSAGNTSINTVEGHVQQQQVPPQSIPIQFAQHQSPAPTYQEAPLPFSQQPTPARVHDQQQYYPHQSYPFQAAPPPPTAGQPTAPHTHAPSYGQYVQPPSPHPPPNSGYYPPYLSWGQQQGGYYPPAPYAYPPHMPPPYPPYPYYPPPPPPNMSHSLSGYFPHGSEVNRSESLLHPTSLLQSYLRKSSDSYGHEAEGVDLAEVLRELKLAKEEAALATKKLADLMVEVHRSQELQARSSPNKKNTTHRSLGHRQSHRQTIVASANVLQEAENGDEDYDEDEYSNDDFEEESTLNASRYSQPQSPSKQTGRVHKSTLAAQRVHNDQEPNGGIGIGDDDTAPLLHPPHLSDRGSVDLARTKPHRGTSLSSYAHSSPQQSVERSRETFDDIMRSSQSLFQRQLTSLRDRLNSTSYSAADLEAARATRQSMSSGRNLYGSASSVPSLSKIQDSFKRDRDHSSSKLRDALKRVDPLLSDAEVDSLMSRYSR